MRKYIQEMIDYTHKFINSQETKKRHFCFILMATLNCFIPLMTYLLYSSSFFLVLFSCFPDRSHAVETHSYTTDSCSHLPASICSPASSADSLRDIDSLRQNLVQQEDTIIFSLIERAKYPINSQMYNNKAPTKFPNSYTSSFDSFIKESEAVQAKFGRYTSEEENAFFPDNLPHPPPPSNCTRVLHRPGACININDRILKLYLNLLPSIAANGDDRDYAATAASDLNCLQALSKRIHYGKFVAEVKYRNDPKAYDPAISAQNRTAIENLLTDPSVEDIVKKRVQKKAKIFGQDVQYKGNQTTSAKYKVKPSIVYDLYNDSVIPLTKYVEVEYFLQRLKND